jgi:anti-sigma B factor antagonist
MGHESRLTLHAIKHVTVVNFHDSSILDMARIQQIADLLYPLVDRNDRRELLLDFTEVEFMSSGALGVLLTLRQKLTKVGGRAVICGMRAELRKVFKIAALDKLFEFVSTEEEGLNSFGVSTKGT